METKKHHRRLNTKTIVIGLLILLIVILFVVYKISQQRYKPIINPNPKHFITIFGKIDPRLHVTFQVVYQTFNEKCRVTDDWFEGAFSPRYYSAAYPVNKSNDHLYKITMPIDQIRKEMCDWHATSIDYSASSFGERKLNTDSMLFAFMQLKRPKDRYFEDFFCFENKFDNKYYLDCRITDTNFNNNIPKDGKNIIMNFKFGVKNESH